MLLNRRERLDLTDDQVKQLEALATEVRQAHEKAATDAKPHEEKLEELWKADQPDVNAIQAEMRALMQVRQTAASAAVTATARAKGLLTDEQRGRVEGWADGRRMGMERRMEMHGRAHGMRRGFRALPRMHRF
jgi:Spy/CpxP family protein refolding chaperone